MISEISIEMNIAEDGNIQFDKKVSCEDAGSQTGNFYDYLAFYIDNIEQEKWAEINWSTTFSSICWSSYIYLEIYQRPSGNSRTRCSLHR